METFLCPILLNNTPLLHFHNKIVRNTEKITRTTIANAGSIITQIIIYNKYSFSGNYYFGSGFISLLITEMLNKHRSINSDIYQGITERSSLIWMD